MGVKGGELATWHNNNKTSVLKTPHSSAAAFLLANEFPEAFNELKSHLPEEASKAVDWLENNYVHSRTKDACTTVLRSVTRTIARNLCVSACGMHLHILRTTWDTAQRMRSSDRECSCWCKTQSLSCHWYIIPNSHNLKERISLAHCF